MAWNKLQIFNYEVNYEELNCEIVTHRIVTLNICVSRCVKSSTVSGVGNAVTVFRAATVVSLQSTQDTSRIT